MLSEFSSFLLNPALADLVRLNPTAFTRDRTLTLPRMAAMMLSGMCTSVQTSLDSFFASLSGQAGRARQVSAQAFSKARRGFSAQLFDLTNQHLLKLAAPRIDIAQWHGFRVVAADASRLHVATREGAELKADHYAFALFLPGVELTLHASLHPADGSERQMLFEVLPSLSASDLLVLDRGYVGNTMAAVIAQANLHFCLRVDRSGWRCVADFLCSNLTEQVVTLKPPHARDASTYELAQTGTTVRLIRDVTPSGKVRVLMTNLLDAERFPAADFGALYHRRWRIEEAFKRLKHRLWLEAVSGLSYLALQQDFAAKVLADNLCALLVGADVPASADSRPNRTYAMGALGGILAGCVLGVKACLALLAPTLDAASQSRCRIQPDRHYPRPRRTKPHKHSNYKGNQ